MADLSQVPNRQTAQDRRSGRRAPTLPRPNTQAQEVKVFADMLTARRGDGGADQLRALFGSVERAAESFTEYAGAKQQQKDQEDGSQGALDSVTGVEDPELAAKSRAYRTSYSKGRAEREALAFINSTTDEVEALLNNPDDPATPDDVDQFLHSKLKDYLIPQGQQREFGSPEARAVAVGRLQEWQEKLRSAALDKIKDQVGTESLTSASDVVRLRAKQGMVQRR